MTMQVAVIDYGSGNLQSVCRSLMAASHTADIDAGISFARTPGEVAAADAIVLPGVGAFGDCRAGLAAIDGMLEAIDEVAVARARPFLGICVGMQLMADAGSEGGAHEGFGWVRGRVNAIAPEDGGVMKIPHMGWNILKTTRRHKIWEGLTAEDAVYFLHSYAFTPANDNDAVMATTDYGGDIVAAVMAGNRIGLQFHPEKSQSRGLRILANWLAWRP